MTLFFYDDSLRPAPLGRNVNNVAIYCHRDLFREYQMSDDRVQLSGYVKFVPDFSQGGLALLAPRLARDIDGLHRFLHEPSTVGKLKLDGLTIDGTAQGPQFLSAVQWLEVCETTLNIRPMKELLCQICTSV